MTPERWQQVKRILEDTLAQDAALRAAHLATACGGDEALRKEVESFLTAETDDVFLEQPAVGGAPPVPDAALDTAAATPSGRVDAVRPVELAPYTTLAVTTRTSRYELVVVAPLELEVLIKGGRRFPESTRAHLYRQETIRVGEELLLVIGTRKVVTTTVEAIEIIR